MILLYSTNVYLKMYIQRQFRMDIHYVWCSEVFDSKKMHMYAPAAGIPPSSNPLDIYRQLAADVHGNDLHSLKISQQRMSLSKRAVEWEKKGEISAAERADILYLIKTAAITDWRPLIYIVPAAIVQSRLIQVPAAKRAGKGMEYIIPDLHGSEFDLLEL